MKTTFIAASLAGALALTSVSATPARAADDNLTYFLGAAAVIGAIAAISSSRRNTRVVRQQAPVRRHVYRPHHQTVVIQRHRPRACRQIVWTPGIGRQCLLY